MAGMMETVRQSVREELARRAEADSAPNKALAIRAGEWDDVFEVRGPLVGAATALEAARQIADELGEERASVFLGAILSEEPLPAPSPTIAGQ